jgi:hypothetical protein
MEATATAIELDLDPDFDAVLARAMARLGPSALDWLGPSEPPCGRALASNRLFLRRWAARRQRPGESWGWLDTFDLVDEELARMGASAEEARGCGCYDCHICHPRVCEDCGGIVAGACAVAS